jgi:hypothetical protein
MHKAVTIEMRGDTTFFSLKNLNLVKAKFHNLIAVVEKLSSFFCNKLVLQNTLMRNFFFVNWNV